MSYFGSRDCGIVRVLVGIALTSPNGVWAATTDSNVIETITVTAEKRESTAQDTAIALTAFDTEDLQLRGIADLTDLQWNTPNLVISPNSQSPVTYAYIRGVGSDQLVAGFDPGVAYHFDGIYVGQPSSMPGDLWDMERVEVLRGPQGTLYGRNTTGGSINVITNDPTDKFEALVDVTGGNYADERVRGAVNVPVTDSIAGRISFIQEQNDGYQDNIFNNSHSGDVTDYYSVRGKLKFDFGDSANLVLTAQTFENDGNQSQRRREPFGPNPAFDGAIPNPNNVRDVGKDFHEKLNLTNHLYSARLTWDLDLGALGPATLVAVSGYIDNNWFQQADIDQSSNAIQFQKWAMDTDQFTQEIRLVSAGDGPWEWIGGFFYFDEHLSSNYVFNDALAFGGGGV
jgi:iron complex outermembrane receptor protein